MDIDHEHSSMNHQGSSQWDQVADLAGRMGELKDDSDDELSDRQKENLELLIKEIKGEDESRKKE